MEPLCIEGFCGLGGWSEGAIVEGYTCIGFDIERHDYGTGGYPGTLVLQDMLTVDGARWKDADLLLMSPPCQEFSYMAMPWSRAKQIGQALRGEGDFPKGYTGSRTVPELTALFDACFRIQREAIEAAGHFIPMVVENVRGAEKWVGRARWHYGSFYLWGDVPALMPPAKAIKNPACKTWYLPDDPRHQPNQRFNRLEGCKLPGFRFDGSGKSFQTASVEGTKQGGDWFAEARKGGAGGTSASYGSKSPARKAASAMIAKIPFALAQYIAAYWKPREAEENTNNINITQVNC
jgi:hypothetical protein